MFRMFCFISCLDYRVTFNYNQYCHLKTSIWCSALHLETLWALSKSDHHTSLCMLPSSKAFFLALFLIVYHSFKHIGLAPILGFFYLTMTITHFYLSSLERHFQDSKGHLLPVPSVSDTA